MKKCLIAPSILAADWGIFNEEISKVEAAGADWIHIDVMDGHFVPPITVGPKVVEAAKKACSIPLDVHLMIENPENQVQAFADAGADYITVHLEACPHLHRVVQQIHAAGAKAGVSINPATPVDLLKNIISDIELLLLMSVNPGWGGQSFIEGTSEKIRQASQMIGAAGADLHLQVDGGINDSTAKEATAAGANVLVAGTYVFGAKDYSAAIESLR